MSPDDDVNHSSLALVRHQSHQPTPDVLVREQVSQRLAEIDAKIEDLYRARAEQKTIWNRSLSINRMPNELLLFIFIDAAEATLRPFHKSLSDVKSYRTNAGRMKLMLVCRDWCELVLATPNLWRVIEVGKNLSWNKMALYRSASLPIDVSCGFKYYSVEHLGLFYPHVHRFRRLRIEVPRATSTPATLALPLYADGMPALECLEFLVAKLFFPDTTLVSDCTDLQLTSERFPRLQSLVLQRTLPPSDMEVFSRLRKLSLTSCACTFDFDFFMDALAASQCLEDLHLCAFLQHLSGDWAPLPMSGGRSPIRLPRLTSLSLQHHEPFYTSEFLSYFVFQSTVSVAIGAVLDDLFDEFDDDADDADDCSFRDILPRDFEAVFPIFKEVTDISVVAEGRQYSLICSGNMCSVQLSIASFVPWKWNIMLWQALLDLVQIFCHARLTSLTIRGDLTHVELDIWLDVFYNYPLLESLKLTSSATGPSMDRYLNRQLWKEWRAGPISTMMCPNLKAISVACALSVEFFEALRDWLRYRDENGARLERLRVELIDLPTQAENAMMRDVYIPEVQSLVTHVDYEPPTI